MKKRDLRPLALCLLMLLCTTALAAEEEIPAFRGLIGKKMTVYAWPRNNSPSIGRVEPGMDVSVLEKGRTWTRIVLGNRSGYVNTKFVEMVQRKDPYEGNMPGVNTHVAMGRAKRNTTFLPYGFKYSIAVDEGTAIGLHDLRNNKAYFPYRREKGDAHLPEEVLDIEPYVPWNEALPGDLLYAFSTFYSMSGNKEGNLNRVYNIDLACGFLTHIRIPVNGTFSFNSVCGPYDDTKGYRTAPILAGESKMGYGGGVCQVCSTIYNIVLRLPLVVEDMNWHSQGGVSYLPAGFDATVSNTKDMVFRNTLPFPLRLEMEARNGIMTAMLYRAEEEGYADTAQQ